MEKGALRIDVKFRQTLLSSWGVPALMWDVRERNAGDGGRERWAQWREYGSSIYPWEKFPFRSKPPV